METKANGSMETKSTVENGQLPDPAHWAVADVVNYFKATGFEEQANAFQDQVSVFYGKNESTGRNRLRLAMSIHHLCRLLYQLSGAAVTAVVTFVIWGRFFKRKSMANLFC